MHLPIVGITTTSRRENPGDPERVRLNAAYVEAVIRAGGVPVVLPPAPPAHAESILDRVDALLLTGGEDVDPPLFGAVPHPQLGRVTRARDGWELALARVAHARRLPLLGVCRGIQVMNVAFGGTLIQDIRSEHRSGVPIAHDQPAPRRERTHAIMIERGSRLAGAYGSSATVNSMHHQAIADVAAGLSVTAVAPDGIIEGVEWAGEDWWAVGVQWHPEELDGADQGLFGAFLAAVRPRGA